MLSHLLLAIHECCYPFAFLQALISSNIFSGIKAKQLGLAAQLLPSPALTGDAAFALCPSAGISPVPHKFANGQDNRAPSIPG